MLCPLSKADDDRERLETIHHSLEAWQGMNGPRDNDGRLRKGMLCCAYKEVDVAMGRTEVKLCTARTKEPSGLCRFHDTMFSDTLWDCDPFEKKGLVSHEVAERDAELESQQGRRQNHWENDPATDRQVDFLLDLGAKPAAIRGIKKKQASDMIDRLLEEKCDRDDQANEERKKADEARIKAAEQSGMSFTSDTTHGTACSCRPVEKTVALTMACNAPVLLRMVLNAAM